MRAVVGVLEWHVDVREDFVRIREVIDQLVVHIHRIKIHQPDPVESVDFFKFNEQFCQPRFSVEIDAIVGGVLGHDD